MRMVLQRFIQAYGNPSSPTAAATVSLVAVTGFTALLGLFFLPAEVERLKPSYHTSVTDYLPPRANRPSLALCWSIAETGKPGWRHFLRTDDEVGNQPTTIETPFQPSSLAVGRTESVLVGGWDGSIYSLQADALQASTQDELVLIGRQQGGGVTRLAPSYDGRYIISQDAFYLYGWDVARRSALWRRPDIQSACLVSRPDESTALVGCLNNDLLEIDLATGQTKSRLAKLEALPQGLALSSDGGQLALILANGQLQLRNSHTLELLWSRQADWLSSSGRFVAISPCSRWVVTPSPDDSCDVAVWDVRRGDFIQSLTGHQGPVLGAVFGEESLLYSFGSDGTVREWELTSTTPGRVAVIRATAQAAG